MSDHDAYHSVVRLPYSNHSLSPLPLFSCFRCCEYDLRHMFTILYRSNMSDNGSGKSVSSEWESWGHQKQESDRWEPSIRKKAFIDVVPIEFLSYPMHSLFLSFFPSLLSEYLWKDGNQYKKPTRVSAPVYIDLLLSWADERIQNPALFPVDISKEQITSGIEHSTQEMSDHDAYHSVVRLPYSNHSLSPLPLFSCFRCQISSNFSFWSEANL